MNNGVGWWGWVTGQSFRFSNQKLVVYFLHLYRNFLQVRVKKESSSSFGLLCLTLAHQRLQLHQKAGHAWLQACAQLTALNAQLHGPLFQMRVGGTSL